MRYYCLYKSGGDFLVEKEKGLLTLCGMQLSQHSGYSDLEWAIGLNRFALKVIGLWPGVKQSDRESFFSNIQVMTILILTILGLLIPMLAALIMVWGDLMSVADNIQISLPVIVTLVKIFIMWRKKQIVTMIMNDWLRNKTKEQREIMIKEAKRARMIIQFGYGFMIVSFCITIIPPCFGFSMRYTTNITDSGRPLILQSYYPYNVSERPSYELTMIVQTLTLSTTALAYTGIDNFLSVVVFHISAQMETLIQRLTRVKEYMDFNSIVVVNVKDHIRLVRCVDIIEDTFHLMLLALLFYSTVIVCIGGFLLLSMFDHAEDVSITRMGWVGCILVTVLMHMGLYCLIGEIIISKNEEVFRATYNNEWYLLEPTEARCLMLIMLQTQRPLYISAGKMFPMTLSMFCNLLKTSMGYMSVLLANRDV